MRDPSRAQRHRFARSPNSPILSLAVRPASVRSSARPAARIALPAPDTRCPARRTPRTPPRSDVRGLRPNRPNAIRRSAFRAERCHRTIIQASPTPINAIGTGSGCDRIAEVAGELRPAAATKVAERLVDQLARRQPLLDGIERLLDVGPGLLDLALDLGRRLRSGVGAACLRAHRTCSFTTCASRLSEPIVRSGARLLAFRSLVPLWIKT